jgi:hypothetical protein
MSIMGQSRPIWAVHAMSGLPPLANELRTSPEVRLVPIVLKKSFFRDGLKFSGPLMRLSRFDVRGHINCRKNDRWPSHQFYGALQRLRSSIRYICVIFGPSRFSSFSTVSAKSRHPVALRRVIWDPIRPEGNLDRPEFCLPAQPECEASLYPAEKSARIRGA